jgi:hypothetical protein
MQTWTLPSSSHFSEAHCLLFCGVTKQPAKRKCSQITKRIMHLLGYI